MKERLQKILREYDLTPSRLAEKLGVQRSGISHIMSGRNKPSYDFLIGLIKAFPGINANWLLTGEGEMLKDLEGADKNIKNESGNSIEPDLFSSHKQDSERTNQRVSTQNKPVKEEDQAVYKSKQNESTGEEIDSIVILLKSGKFKQYRSD